MRSLESGTITLLNRPFQVFGDADDSQFSAFLRVGTWEQIPLHRFSAFLKPDSICLDLGANIGMVTLALSLLCPKGHVYAFEASKDTAEALRQTALANHLKNVSVGQAILGDEDKEVRFFDIPGVSTSSFAVSKESDKTVHVLTYPYTDKESNVTVARTKSVDQIVRELNIPRVDFIKIDVEGSELDVLDGAKETLARFKPIILMEFNSRCFISARGILPAQALSKILQTFDSVYWFKHENGTITLLERAEVEREKFLTANYDQVADLLCCFDGAELHNFRLLDEIQNLKFANEQLQLKLKNKWISVLKRKFKRFLRRFSSPSPQS